MTTNFKTTWDEWVRREPRLADPEATIRVNVAFLRRLALECFSSGVVHHSETQQRLERLRLDDPRQTSEVVIAGRIG